MLVLKEANYEVSSIFRVRRGIPEISKVIFIIFFLIILYMFLYYKSKEY